MSRRNLENYVPVNVRVMQAREKYKEKLSILTEVRMLTDKDGTAYGAYVIAAICLDGIKIANGHAMAGDLNDDKSIEKAESSAVGRGLAFAGFSADAAIASAEDMKDVIEQEEAESVVPSRVFTPKATVVETPEATLDGYDTQETDGDTAEEVPAVAPKSIIKPNVLSKFKKPNVPPSLAGGNQTRRS